LTHECEGLPAPRGSGLVLLKSTFNAVLVCLTILAQFTFKMCVAAQNCEKFTKTLYFEGSPSSKVIDVPRHEPIAVK